MDKKLAKQVTEVLGIPCKSSSAIKEVFRGLRSQMSELIEGLDDKNMTLALAHGLSRFKLKFSSEKVDTMIIQAVSLLDDLDKELNNYMMRLKEWYGWHFPELAKIVTDNLLYARTVLTVGIKTKFAETDLGEILTEEVEKDVKEAAEISMGTEISEKDEKYIQNLAQQCVELGIQFFFVNF